MRHHLHLHLPRQSFPQFEDLHALIVLRTHYRRCYHHLDCAVAAHCGPFDRVLSRRFLRCPVCSLALGGICKYSWINQESDDIRSDLCRVQRREYRCFRESFALSSALPSETCLCKHQGVLADPRQYTVVAGEVVIKYRSTWIAVLCAISFTIVASLVLRVAFARENKRRDAIAASAPALPISPPLVGATAGQETAAASDEGNKEASAAETEPRVSNEGIILTSLEQYKDRTDKQLPSFRYAL